jgi:ribosomal protein S18 acetylase RimI-like enzyme
MVDMLLDITKDIVLESKTFGTSCYIRVFLDKKEIASFYFGQEYSDIKTYCISSVYVEEEFRRMGIATMMLEYGIELAKEKYAAKRLYLRSAPQAITLYEKLGFKKINNSECPIMEMYL